MQMKIALFPGKCNQKYDILFAYTLNRELFEVNYLTQDGFEFCELQLYFYDTDTFCTKLANVIC